MGFFEAVKSVFKNYANFKGRASRSEYWYFYLFNILVMFFAYGLLIGGTYNAKLIGGDSAAGSAFMVVYVFIAIYYLAVFIPNMSVLVRRLHDTNRSGWNWLWCLLPIVGIIVLLVFLVSDSYPVENKYGAPPKVQIDNVYHKECK